MDNHLNQTIKAGRLNVIAPDGTVHTLQGSKVGPEATIRVTDRQILRRMMVVPDLYLGEGYMEGKLTVEEGSLYDVLDFFALNLMPRVFDITSDAKVHADKPNVVGKAKDNVAFHYDLNRALFELFLDEDLQYSCAYFTDPGQTLETAQLNKKKRVSSKLLIKPGMRVLDIGSGFGGLSMHIARTYGVDVVGLTLSEEQWHVSQQRAKAEGLDRKVTFRLQDYRHETGSYDRIVSVGMFEHVGRGHFDEFFNGVKNLLADDGIALLHSIGSMAPPGGTSPWLVKYIFPGGYAPALSETFAAIERAGLWATDTEILRLHYAETLRNWHQRFQVNRDKARALYDERFCRMFEYYLLLCQVGYRRLNWMNFQIQLAKSVDTVPMTRSYLKGWETNRV